MESSQALADRLSGHPEVLFALLFGSRASGRARPDSDTDLGIFLSPDLTAQERWEARLRIQADLEILGAVDVVVLNDAPPLLAHRALLGDPILVKDRKAYVRYFVRTLAGAEDERHWREVHRKARLERLREGRYGRP